MDNTTLPNRRLVLKGLPVAIAATALPTLALADAGKMASLIEAHKAALLARDAAWAREDEAYSVFDKAMTAAPVVTELPGLRWLPYGMTHPVSAWELSAERVTELYDHYDFYSRRGGAAYVGGKFVPIDLSADRARDEAAAQANLAAAKDRIAQISADCGLTVAEAAARAGDEAVTSALCDIVAYTPADEAEGRAKAAYLLAVIAEGGSDFFDDDMTRKLIASFAGSAAPRLLAEAVEAEHAGGVDYL